MAGKLESIARDMRAEVVRDGGTARRYLQRGLTIELSADLGGWLLVLSRPRPVVPSDQEIAIVRAAFGVPADAEPVRGDYTVSIQWRP